MPMPNSHGCAHIDACKPCSSAELEHSETRRPAGLSPGRMVQAGVAAARGAAAGGGAADDHHRAPHCRPARPCSRTHPTYRCAPPPPYLSRPILLSPFFPLFFQDEAISVTSCLSASNQPVFLSRQLNANPQRPGRLGPCDPWRRMQASSSGAWHLGSLPAQLSLPLQLHGAPSLPYQPSC